MVDEEDYRCEVPPHMTTWDMGRLIDLTRTDLSEARANETLSELKKYGGTEAEIKENMADHMGVCADCREEFLGEVKFRKTLSELF
jgi:hypothetical protein